MKKYNGIEDNGGKELSEAEGDDFIEEEEETANPHYNMEEASWQGIDDDNHPPVQVNI